MIGRLDWVPCGIGCGSLGGCDATSARPDDAQHNYRGLIGTFSGAFRAGAARLVTMV